MVMVEGDGVMVGEEGMWWGGEGVKVVSTVYLKRGFLYCPIIRDSEKKDPAAGNQPMKTEQLL